MTEFEKKMAEFDERMRQEREANRAAGLVVFDGSKAWDECMAYIAESAIREAGLQKRD